MQFRIADSFTDDVACTRARDLLLVTGVDPGSEFLAVQPSRWSFRPWMATRRRWPRCRRRRCVQ